MANNLIQIKRSLNTANATGLANGELAWSSNGDILWIGANSVTLPITGKRYPGTLTANQALVANATSGIDKVIVANLVPIAIWANGAQGSAGHVLKSSGAGTNVYWEAVTVATSVAGSDTQIQYNDGGSTLAGATGFTYSKTTNNVAIANTLHIPANNAFGNATTGGTLANSTAFASGNSTVNAVHTSSLFQVTNSTGTANLTAIALTVGTSVVNTTVLAAGANVIANTISFFVGNSVANVVIGSTLIKITNSTSTANLSPVDLVINTSVVNSSVIAAGANVIVSTSSVFVGNSTVNATHTSSLLQVSNTTNTANLTAIDLKIGATVVNTTAVAVGANVIANTTALYIGNSTVNAVTTSTVVQISNSTGIANLTPIDLKIGGYGSATSGFVSNTTAVAVGNSTVNTIATATLIQLSNSTTIANLSSIDLKLGGYGNTTTGGSVTNTIIFAVGNSTVNAIINPASITVGANITVNATTFFVGNSTANASATSLLIQVSNSTAIANLTPLALTVGTSVVNTTVLAAGANVIANTTALFLGNSTVNAIATSLQLQVSNSTGISNLTAIDLKIGGYGSATSGFVGNTTAFGVGNSTVNVIANSSSVFVGANVSINATAFDVGNTTISTVNAIFGGSISVNNSVGTAGYVLISGGSSTNAYWSNTLPGLFYFTDVTVSGNLTVLGDFVSLNVSSLSIEDPLIVLAKDQAAGLTYTDAVDIGFIAPYGNTTTANSNWTGFFRDQSDSGVYKLFSGNIPTPTTTVDTTNTNFTFATLQAQLKTGGAGAGGFISNSTTIAITANSTLNVAIVANTLTLSTALVATSGGTGQSVYANGDILVGNSSNFLNKLAAGSDGYVLQINGTGIVAWNTLDGGTF